MKYFMITKKLNRRQTKWAEFLVEFDFKIAYQSNKKNDKANSFTRRSDDRSDNKNESNSRNKHMYQIILSSKKVDSRVLQKINDTETKELKLFDKIKTTNQTNEKCTAIRISLERNEKNWNKMLLKDFENKKTFYSSRKSYEFRIQINWSLTLYEKFTINQL